MSREPQECLKRAGECVRLAEAERDPELRAYLIKLGSSWAQAARELDEGKRQDAQRPPAVSAHVAACDVARASFPPLRFRRREKRQGTRCR